MEQSAIPETPNLTRLGNLLIDLKTVHAVAPIWFDDSHVEAVGFEVVTNGGVLAVRDVETVEAIREQFYESLPR